MTNSPEFEIYRQEMNLKLAERFLAAAKINKLLADGLRSGEWGSDIKPLPIPRWSALDDVPSAELPQFVDNLAFEWKRKADILLGQVKIQ